MQVSELHAARAQRRLTVGELAQSAGVSPLTVRRLEAGRPARITTVVKLSRALGVEWRDLVGAQPVRSREPQLRLGW